jgi:hypothetical protein
MLVSADLSTWPRDVRDTCGNVFGQSLRAFAPPIKSDARVLEIGCAEFDALKHATKAWPQMAFTGIDWRKSQPREPDWATRIQGDVMKADFAPESFDWVFSISAMEHIGLGHYQADPTAEKGDILTMGLVQQWLVPGGWVYLDVPWNPKPNSYEVVRTSHRVYDDAAVAQRLVRDFHVRWSGVYEKSGAVVTDPQPLKGGESFYYKAYWLQKG